MRGVLHSLKKNESSRSTPYLASMLFITPWAALMLWYGIALIGLSSWGRVTTWPILRTYASQHSHLLASLGLPTWLPYVPLALLLTVILAVGWSRFMRPDWTCVLRLKASQRHAVLLSTLMALFPAALFSTIHLTGALHPEEPIELSFYPQLGVKKESIAFSSSPAVNAAEEEARKNYQTIDNAVGRKNVILIVGDALRDDHMSVYGYERETTPYLSSLAAENKLQIIPRARATCTESMCGYMSLASSRPVHTMPAKPFTLHEALRRNGYKVHLMLSGDHTNFYGLRDFYGDVDSYMDGSDQPLKWGEDGESFLRYINDDQLVLDEVVNMPPAIPDQPVMLQIVLMSSHGLGTRKPENEKFVPYFNYYALVGRNLSPTFGEKELQVTANFYDNGVYQFDDYVRMILSELEKKGYLNNALLVITGDHGEMIGERNLTSHGNGVYEPALRIPLILARFGYESPSIPEHAIASQIDIAPTILTELGLSVPSTWAGHALQAPMNENRIALFQQAAEAGLYQQQPDGRLLKYWRNFNTDEEHVYDVRQDAGETNNLADEIDPVKIAGWRIQVAHGGLQVGESFDIPFDLPALKAPAAPEQP